MHMSFQSVAMPAILPRIKKPATRGQQHTNRTVPGDGTRSAKAWGEFCDPCSKAIKRRPRGAGRLRRLRGCDKLFRLGLSAGAIYVRWRRFVTTRDTTDEESERNE